MTVKENTAFFDEYRHLFGTVWAASGYIRRVPGSGNRLDWALIKPYDDRRRRENLLASKRVWDAFVQRLRSIMMTEEQNNNRRPPQSHSVELDIPSQNGMNGKLKAWGKGKLSLENKKVFKVGAISGATAGLCAPLKVLSKIREEKYMNQPATVHETKEYMMSSKWSSFGQQGDSGAVVHDADGVAVGLLFSGQAPSQTDKKNGYSLVTPLPDVFKDIMDFDDNITSVELA